MTMSNGTNHGTGGDGSAEAQRAQAVIGPDRFRIRHLLGRGGMSTVWLADDLAGGGRVAVKMLNRELGDDPEFRQRFRNEASAAQSVSSPNVVNIYSHDDQPPERGGGCYIIMEYIRGESLADVLRRRSTLPEHLALDVLEQTAHGLSAIHAANLIHRDIKPGNLLVTPEGTVKITDFGIAKAAEAVPLTRTGMVVGTAQYVSPEQAQGKNVTPATDVYSMGCVAYEMLSGRRPFAGDTTVAVAVAHISEAPPPLPQTVHPHIRELVGIMLRKDPARRYADGRELAQAVVRVRQGNRPPQPRGVAPAVHRQSDAAHPATSELGALTVPGNGRRGPAPTGRGPAPRPQPRQAAPPPRRKKSNAGLWFSLLVLLALLAGAVWFLYDGLGGGTPETTTVTTPPAETGQPWSQPEDTPTPTPTTPETSEPEPEPTPSETPVDPTPTDDPDPLPLPPLPGLPDLGLNGAADPDSDAPPGLVEMG